MEQSRIHRFPWGVSDHAQVWIVDFGSKSTPLIAQQCREIGLMSRQISAKAFPDAYTSIITKPKLVILSGGDQSVYDKGSLTIPKKLYELMTRESAVLGICYGAQLMAKLAGGKVKQAASGEYGMVNVRVQHDFGEYSGGSAVMNHRDEIVQLPMGWFPLGSTAKCVNAFVGGLKTWAVQFHPEMDHTEDGEKILRHMAYRIAGCREDYTFDPKTFAHEAGEWMFQLYGHKQVLCGLSGGVDSAVAYVIGSKTLDLCNGMYIDTGWFREGETEEVRSIFGDIFVSYVDASALFYRRLEAIKYPRIGHPTKREGDYYEQVRKVIGKTFIDVFLEQAKKLDRKPVALMQGTNAADIVESTSGLKSHHNVGGLPDKLNVDIVEPLAGLYKFEIRALAGHLGLPDEIVYRQPFPGPGLAIRTWGKLSRKIAAPLRTSNRILEEVMRKYIPDPRKRPCQYYVALAPLPSTGLMGDKRVIGYAFVVRMVSSKKRESYASLDAFRFERDAEEELNQRLTSEVVMEDGTRFVRVFYEGTGKPPSTTEPH